MLLNPESTHFDHIYECICEKETVYENVQPISQYREGRPRITCKVCKRRVYGKRREYIKPKNVKEEYMERDESKSNLRALNSK